MLVRKINKAKWIYRGQINDEPSADAITNCLKTTQNTLSVWYITNETEIEEAVLAIVSGQEHLETIDIILLDENYLTERKISIEKTEGNTPISELRNKHRDLSSLDYRALGIIAYNVVENLKKNQLKRFTERKLKEILYNAVEQQRLELTDLSINIQRKIQIYK